MQGEVSVADTIIDAAITVWSTDRALTVPTSDGQRGRES